MRVVIVVLVVFLAWGTIGFAYESVVYDDETNNCKHQSIALHNWLAECGIESHYAGARESAYIGHVWVVVDVCGIGIPIESTSLGVINPLEIERYLYPDWAFATTEEMMAFGGRGAVARFLVNDTTDEHEYDLSTYNCVDFSHALVENLSIVGFDCGYVLMTPYIIDDHRIPHLLVRVGDYVVEPINDEVKGKKEFEMDAYEIGFVVAYKDSYP